MRHVVMFGGGLASFGVLKRVVERYGASETVALIADTGTEDADLWRFTYEAKMRLGCQLKVIAIEGYGRDGGDIWDLFDAENFIGKSGADICSRMMKREPLRKYIEEHYDPAETVVYLGFDATEEHRMERSRPHWEPWTIAAPLVDDGVWKDQVEAEARAMGIEPPRLYAMGFSHNNCGGFCVKAGHGALIHLLKQMPDRYAYHEERERQFRERTGKDVSVAKDRRGGETKPLTLEALRIRYETEPRQIDMFDIGGCDCFLPGDEDAA